MKITRILLIAIASQLFCATIFAESNRVDKINSRFVRDDLEAPSFEVSTETAYLLGVFGNPHSYEVAAQFVTARWRWGAIHGDGIFHGYNQFYFLVMGEAFTRGYENHYFGISTGFRYNFVHAGSRFTPYISGGIGLGDVDATRRAEPGSLGQSFTFNILTAVGVTYKINDHWRATVGAQYEHLSNAGLSEPERSNSSLNLIGPQIGLTCTF